MQGELHPPPPATATRLQSHPPPPPIPFHSRRVWGRNASRDALGAPLRYCPLPAIEERPLIYSPAARRDSSRYTPSSLDSATASVLRLFPSPHPPSLSPPPPPHRHSHCCVCPVPPATLHPLHRPHLPTAIMAFVAAAAPLGRPSHCGTALTTRPPAAATPAAAATTRMATPPLNPEGEKDKVSSYTLVTGAKVGLCRCYKSKDFPLCNGAHAGYNKKVRRGGGGKMGVALERECCSQNRVTSHAAASMYRVERRGTGGRVGCFWRVRQLPTDGRRMHMLIHTPHSLLFARRCPLVTGDTSPTAYLVDWPPAPHRLGTTWAPLRWCQRPTCQRRWGATRTSCRAPC